MLIHLVSLVMGPKRLEGSVQKDWTDCKCDQPLGKFEGGRRGIPSRRVGAAILSNDVASSVMRFARLV